MRLSQNFSVPHPREHVWNAFNNVEALAKCFPGAKITRSDGLEVFSGEVTAKLGPMRLRFVGDGKVERNPESWSGKVHGKGRDKGSSSGAKATLSFKLVNLEEGAETLVEVEADYALSGSLAQIGRGAIVEEFARQITNGFSASLNEMLSQNTDFKSPKPECQEGGGDFRIGWVLVKSIWITTGKFFSGIFGKQ